MISIATVQDLNELATEMAKHLESLEMRLQQLEGQQHKPMVAAIGPKPEIHTEGMDMQTEEEPFGEEEQEQVEELQEEEHEQEQPQPSKKRFEVPKQKKKLRF